MGRVKWAVTLAAASTLTWGLTGLAATEAAAASTPPTIVKASMVAPKGSHFVDAVKLTYSASIKHKKQKSGTFPFDVEGYVVTGVSASMTGTKSKELVVSVKPHKVSDLTVTPFITYTPPKSNPVESAKGSVQAVSQLFIGTTAASPSSAIYVATTGSDANPGTKAAPLASIQAGITKAASRSPVPDVYVATGVYTQPIATLTGHVDLDGGFAAGTWKRTLSVASVIEEPYIGLTLDNATVSVQLMTVDGLTGPSGGSTYGILALSSELTLEFATVIANDGGAGLNGSNGTGGTNGTNGEDGADGGIGGTGANDGGAGGVAVTGPVAGNAGANGAGPDAGTGGTPGAAGGGCGSPLGGNSAPPDATAGDSGTNGANGGAAAAGVAGPVGWGQLFGGSGTSGTNGSGGGGGGSGSGTAVLEFLACNDVTGGAGGGGGGGAGGGIAGTGAEDGGGSFALYLYDSSVSVDATSAAAAQNGGAGGAGGDGGLGGLGGAGGAGQAVTNDAGNGAAGASGGRGGNAGSGAGGDGGPSISIAEVGTSTATVAPGATLDVGNGGSGGAGGSNTQLGQAPSGSSGVSETIAML